MDWVKCNILFEPNRAYKIITCQRCEVCKAGQPLIAKCYECIDPCELFVDILGIRIQKVEGASFIAAEGLRNSRHTAERVCNATAVQWIDKTICNCYSGLADA